MKPIFCPKCNHVAPMNGPHYRGPGEYQPPGFVVPVQNECLMFICSNCGYRTTRSTADQNTPNNIKGGAE